MNSIKSLHESYGAYPPESVMTPEVYQQFLDYKEQYQGDWLNSEYIYVLAVIDRYNEELKRRGIQRE